MPVITVQFIRDVVATLEQKRDPVTRPVSTVAGIAGGATRSFACCLIDEPGQLECIAGVPPTDLLCLTSEKRADVTRRLHELVRSAIAQMRQGRDRNANAMRRSVVT
ncbi:MAG: hypothetical protein DIU68_011860 [Chloroflexota bacterium]|nr:MAG: hypothetical protein DIU68_05490 [Chloroflexota bacterium]